MRQLAVGEFIPVDDPGVFEDLFGSQSLMGVHVQHFRYKVLVQGHSRD